MNHIKSLPGDVVLNHILSKVDMIDIHQMAMVSKYYRKLIHGKTDKSKVFWKKRIKKDFQIELLEETEEEKNLLTIDEEEKVEKKESEDPTFFPLLSQKFENGSTSFFIGIWNGYLMKRIKSTKNFKNVRFKGQVNLYDKDWIIYHMIHFKKEISHFPIKMTHLISPAIKYNSGRFTRINATQNKFSSLYEISRAIKSYNHAEEIYMERWKGDTPENLCESLKNILECKTIKKLSLINMRITDDIIEKLSETFKNTTLETLDLSSNEIRSKGGMSLARALRDNNTLKYLTLNNNRIGYKAMNLFLESSITIYAVGNKLRAAGLSADKALEGLFF